MADAASLTADERLAQDVSWNLADAHARQRMSGPERESVLDRFPEIFTRAENLVADLPYSELEQRAALAFLRSLGQDPVNSTIIPVYSSSIATLVVSRLLSRRGLDVSLTRPTFDNLYALLQGEKLTVRPRDVNAKLIDEVAAEDWPKCIFEVSPNNPTGHVIQSADLELLAKVCADTGRLLVLDQSFKGHTKEACFDHYSVLEASRAEYIVIEDTGKLWPMLDMKLAFLTASQKVGEELRAITNDILLNVSPFHLEVIKEYAEYSSTCTEHYGTIRGVISANREALRNLVTEFPALLEVAYPQSDVGVEVLNVTSSHYVHLMTELESRNVAVLPTDKFFWGKCHESGRSQIRVALSRDERYMQEALAFFRQAAEATLSALHCEQ